MADKFSSFATLSREHREGRDFSINVCDTKSLEMCVIAPHAGKIEFQTGELTAEIAHSDYCFYMFIANLPVGNRDLHVTSHIFDEPRALTLLAKCKTALGIYGRNDKAKVNGSDVADPETIYLGGLDTRFVSCLNTALCAAGFTCLTTGHKFMAQNPKNVCNRGLTGKGAQLELPKSLRTKLRSETARRKELVTAVRAAIAQYLEPITQ